MSYSTQLLGVRGERIAEKWLRSRGFEIAERRFRNGHRDIDLIAVRRVEGGGGRIIAFVEVKTRSGAGFGGPLGAVNWRKQRELVRSAKVWSARYQQPGDVLRFDVIGVIIGTDGARVRHVENAFAVRSGF